MSINIQDSCLIIHWAAKPGPADPGRHRGKFHTQSMNRELPPKYGVSLPYLTICLCLSQLAVCPGVFDYELQIAALIHMWLTRTPGHCTRAQSSSPTTLENGLAKLVPLQMPCSIPNSSHTKARLHILGLISPVFDILAMCNIPNLARDYPTELEVKIK